MAIDKLGSVSGADVVKMKECGSVDTACSGPVSAYGDKIIEEKPTEFTQNTLDKYNEDDYDRFNTLLSGRNGAEAQSFAKVITANVNKACVNFKKDYPDSNLDLPAPPNPTDFDKGKKGYHAYREALLVWQGECENAIAAEKNKLFKQEPDVQAAQPEQKNQAVIYQIPEIVDSKNPATNSGKVTEETIAEITEFLDKHGVEYDISRQVERYPFYREPTMKEIVDSYPIYKPKEEGKPSIKKIADLYLRDSDSGQ